MQKRSIYALLTALLTLSSCGNGNKGGQSSTEGIEITYASSDEKKMPTDTCFTNFRVFIPETTDSTLITDVVRMRIHDDKVYILGSDNTLLCFDSEGKCEVKIAEKGSGPGQYGNAKDFDIDETDGAIYMLADNKILKYNAQGKYLGESIDVGYDQEIAVTKEFIYVSKNTYPSGKKEDFNITVINRKDNSVSEILPTLEEFAPFCDFAVTGLNRTGEKVWFTRKFDSKIYTLSNGEANEWLNLNLGDRFMHPTSGETIECAQLNSIAHDEKVIYKMGNVVANDSSCVFVTNLNNAGMVSVANKEIQLVKTFTDIPNGLLSGTPIQVSAKIPTVAFVIDCGNLPIMAEFSGNEHIKELSEKLSPESNPLFFIYELK